MRRKRSLMVLVAGAAAGACLLVAGYYQRDRAAAPPAASPPATSAGYIDSAICAGCHYEIARTYTRTGMGRSFYRPTPENSAEDFRAPNTYYHAPSDRYYTMLERDGTFYQRRHQIGPDGEETNVMEVPIDFVVGSGNHARSYLHRTPEGKLVQLPVTRYTEAGGYWAMSPGYDRATHRDFRRAVPDKCIFCHNAYPQWNPGAGRTRSELVFPAEMPEGIDCQRCHGPGQAHVHAVVSRADQTAVRDAIVNPRRLDPDRQMETCMQCHLETTSSPLPHALTRVDRDLFSFRPGTPLGEYFLHFDHAPGTGREDKFEIAGGAYRLRQSACFRESRMTCLTCHNPHDIPRGNEAVQHYVSVCQSCHQAPHPAGPPHTAGASAGATCMDCHMPKRRAEDAVHVVMTDHLIQRRRPARDLLAPRREAENFEKGEYRGEVVLYYPENLPGTAATELHLAVAQVHQGSNLEGGIPRLQQAVEKHKPEQPDFYFELGRAYAKAGNRQAAIRWNEAALERDPGFLPALKELGVLLMNAGQLTRAAELLERAAAVSGPDSLTYTDLGNTYLRQDKVQQAEEAFQKALTLDPDIPEANNLMGLARLRQQDDHGAERYFRRAIRVEPGLAEARNNLGNLLAGRGNYREAAGHFAQAIASNPAYVEAQHSYGIVLAMLRSYEKAIAALEETIRLAPDLAQARNDLGEVLLAAGRVDRAAAAYRRAIEVNPANDEAHLALAGILLRQARTGEARRHLEIAARSPDPAVRQPALDALRTVR